MLRKSTKLEAAKFIQEFGAEALEKVMNAAQDARRSRNERKVRFLTTVARRIAHDTADTKSVPSCTEHTQARVK
jgi:hypothetical protein